MRRIPRTCRTKGCTRPTHNQSGHCDTHQRDRRRAYQQQTARYHTPEWRALRQRVLNRDHDQCVVCMGTYRLTAHHLHAVRDGGRDTLDNLVTLCGRCHSQLESGDTTISLRLAEHLHHSPHHEGDTA